MGRLYRFIVSYVIFWIVFFFVARLLFLANNLSGIDSHKLNELFFSFYKGFAMDIASACYISLLPVIITIAFYFLPSKSPAGIIKIYSIVLLVIVSLIIVSDISLYGEWGTKINSKAIGYILFPKEFFAIAGSVPLFAIIVQFVFLTGIAIIVYTKTVVINHKQLQSGWWAKLCFSLTALVLLFLGCRGGIQPVPLNRSWIYFSNKPVMNNAALNSFWNFLDVISQPVIKDNPYKYFDKVEAQKRVMTFIKESNDSTIKILKEKRPNIILIVLESFSAENITGIDGDTIAPDLATILKEGVYFNNAYSTGFRTEQGLIALLNSFPAQPKESIMRHFAKFEHIPGLPKILDSTGYFCSYYYGGDIKFANTEAFLLSSKFKKIVNEKYFTNPKFMTRWGASDEDLFNCFMKDAGSSPRPFFSILMSSTSHEPFDAPVELVYKGKSENDKYKNTIRYTDKCLVNFLNEAKKCDWYKNTLFIITADHAHSHPGEHQYKEPLRYKIPLLFYGDVLKSECIGKIMNNPVSQIDIAPSVLAQLGIDRANLLYGKNVFNAGDSTIGFYTFNNGFGLITRSQEIVFDHDLGKVIYLAPKESPIDSLSLNLGKAFLQDLMENYIHL
jgi:phosphoglycerol transferase MdoB-like AlkP superfamily enzyme